MEILVPAKERMDVDGPSSNQPDLSDAYAQKQLTGSCSDPGNEEVNEMAEGSSSETYLSSKPDFSLLNGEICLDNFTIRELQEAFRATFGRHTSVKDKLWLKRRIAMGLTNSCDVPSTKFIIKDHKIVLTNIDEVMSETNLSGCGLLIMNRDTDLLNESSEEFLKDTANRIEEQHVSSSKGPDKPLHECDANNENTQLEQCGAKRNRKPTRRYIEELSEVEARECSGRVTSLEKNTFHDEHSHKSLMRTTYMFDNSPDLLEGYGTRIPCGSRVRRRRPRKNFLALVNFVHMGREKRDPEVLNSERSSQEQPEKMISSIGASSHDNSHAVQTVEASFRRKHHRAWTLGEVLNLVEGVSRYGAGRWSEIRRVAFSSCSHRTSVDLKDKWRNLLKASFAQVPPDKGIGSSRKQASVPIPTSILLRVRELAERHSQSGLEFGTSQFVDHGGRIVHENEMGFL